jgi:hypothetical protein
MNVPLKIDLNTSNPTDAQIQAFDAVLELASVLSVESAALIAASASADIAATEARLWTCRRTLAAAIVSWREAIPGSSPNEGGAGV